MPNYSWYEPEAVVTVPADDIITYPPDSSYNGQFDNRIAAHPEYLQLAPFYHNLHSMIRNNAYTTLYDSLIEEYQNIITEKLFFLRLAYDIKYYTGDEDDFYLKLGNVLETLDYQAPLFFTKYTNAEVSSETDQDKAFAWLREIAFSIYLQRKWAGSLNGYKLVPKLLKRLGTVYLRAQYVSEGNFTVFSDKYFRLMEDNSYRLILPGGSSSVWPNTGHVLGSEDYSTVDISYFKWDTSHTTDEEIATDVPLKWDTGLVIGNEGKGLLIDITIDRLLYHTNTLSESLCLMDNPWILCMESILPNIRRGADKVMLGSQISLVATADGRYTNVSHPVAPPGGFVPGTELYEQEQQASYTHPNVQAKFQVFPTAWVTNKEVEIVRLGEGILADVFMGATDDPLDPLRVLPTNIAQPLFETSVGQYEKAIASGYYAITPTIHKGVFSDKTVNSLITIGGSTVLDSTIANSTISVPHRTMAKGSVAFLVKVALTEDESYDRYISITDYFNVQTQAYDTKTTLYKKNQDGALIPVISKLAINYFNDNSYSIDFDYVEWASDDIISLLPIVGYTTSSGGDAYSVINYELGEVYIRPKISDNSLLKEETATVEVECITECSYSVNAVQRGIEAVSKEATSNLVRITEVGLFNIEGDMVAYGAFPPIIYDADKYHLSLNLLLQI